MKPRMNFYQAAPETIKALSAVEAQIAASGLEKSLIELVKTRASQINGCAFCINMHTQDARKLGETEQRLYMLSAWRELPLYTDRERAALAWTEAVTLIADTHAPDDLYEELRAHFSEAEMVNLTMLIGAINAWNRIAIAFPRDSSGEGKGCGGVGMPSQLHPSTRLRKRHFFDWIAGSQPGNDTERERRLTPPSPWRTRHRSRAAGWSSGRACRRRPSCRRSIPPPARTRWRW